MADEVQVDDYIFERTLTHLKLVSEKRIEECKERQLKLNKDKNKQVHLWDVVVEMQYLTKETVDEVLESYINHQYATVSPAKEKSSHESVKMSINDVKLKSENLHKGDILFLKTCVSNSFLTLDVANSVAPNVPINGKVRSWEYIIQKDILKEKIVHKILMKLHSKFPLKFEGVTLPEFKE